MCFLDEFYIWNNFWQVALTITKNSFSGIAGRNSCSGRNQKKRYNNPCTDTHFVVLHAVSIQNSNVFFLFTVDATISRVSSVTFASVRRPTPSACSYRLNIGAALSIALCVCATSTPSSGLCHSISAVYVKYVLFCWI